MIERTAKSNTGVVQWIACLLFGHRWKIEETWPSGMPFFKPRLLCLRCEIDGGYADETNTSRGFYRGKMTT